MTTASDPAMLHAGYCRFQFNLRTLPLIPPLIVMFVGLAALIEVAAVFIEGTVGIEWMSRTRHWLISLGVPEWFVAGYVAFALTHWVEWALLALVNFVLGLLRSRPAQVGAWLLAIAYPLEELINDASVSSLLLTSFHVRMVSLCGLPIGLIAWFIGWRLRGRSYHLAKRLEPKRLRVGLLIGIWTLLAIGSSAGWLIMVRAIQYSRPVLRQMDMSIKDDARVEQ